MTGMEVPQSPEQRAAAPQHDPLAVAHRQLQVLIQEGIDSPTVPADLAFARLREIDGRLSNQ
jgi:hypothetical protein